MMMVGGEGCETTGGPGGGPDPMRPTHCPGQTDEEYRSEGALYAMVSSPMMVGTDIRNMTSIMNEVLLNRELIAIQQDTSHSFRQGLSGGLPSWTRQLEGGKLAVAVLNNNSYAAEAAAVFVDIGWGQSPAQVRDVFATKVGDPDQGAAIIADGVFRCRYTKALQPHDTLLLVLSPAPPTPTPAPPPPRCPPPTPRPTPVPTPPGRCTSYCSSTGCRWTAQYSCPWAPEPGTSGRAGNDGSAGYNCCCVDRTSQNQPCGGPPPAATPAPPPAPPPPPRPYLVH
jgi:hypothetical protein